MTPSSFCESEAAAGPKFSVASELSELPDDVVSVEVVLNSTKSAPLSGPSFDCGLLGLDEEGVGVATFLVEVITFEVAEFSVFDDAGFVFVSVEEGADDAGDEACPSPPSLLPVSPILVALG